MIRFSPIVQRPSPLRHRWLTVVAAALFSLVSLTLHARQHDRPNIILIMADDVGIEAFPTYGGEDYRLPHLDRLAAEGTQFDHCYSQPLCTPSRVKLMTGLRNVRNYRDFSILDPAQVTFGHLLQKAGYRTAVTGKWQLLGARHYGPAAGTGMRPEDAGFDHYRLWQVSELGSRYHDPLLVEDGRTIAANGQYGPDLFADFAIDFISKKHDRPFFLYYPMALVHDPFVPTPDSARADQNRQENFADMLTYLDKIVGQIRDTVEKQGIAERTLILFTSDNGTLPAIRSHWKGQLVRGGKGLPTDAGTHVPLYAWWPGTVPAGGRSLRLVEFSDFVPTLLDLAATAPPEGLTFDGESFLPELRGDVRPPRSGIYIYSNARPTRPNFRIDIFARDRRYKLYSDGRFFDVAGDRAEAHPLAGELTDDAMAARVRLQAILDQMPAKGQNLVPHAVRQ